MEENEPAAGTVLTLYPRKPKYRGEKERRKNELVT
jgi:hypothetical protein